LFNDSAKLFDFLKKNRDTQKQNEAIMNFARGTDVLGLRDFLERCQWEGFKAPLVAYGVVCNLVSGGGDDMVSSLLATANKASPLYGIFNVGQSFVDCKNFEVESCGYHLREGVYHCLRDKVDIPDLGFIMQNAYLMESVAWPSPERYPEPTFEILRKDMYEDSPYIAVMCASPVYFNSYWDASIKNIRESLGNISVLMILINPTEDSIAKIKSCEGVTAAKTHFSGEKVSEFLALLAVFAIRECLKIFNKPALFLELDSVYPRETKEVLEFMANCAYVYADTKEIYPGLKIDGAAIAAKPCDDGFSCLAAQIEYERECLAARGPIYLFDQLARYRVVAKGRKAGWEMTDINEHTKGGFRRLFKEEGDISISLDERKKMRASGDYTFAGMSEDRRVIVRKIHQ
jgi:hypothetical protein